MREGFKPPFLIDLLITSVQAGFEWGGGLSEALGRNSGLLKL